MSIKTLTRSITLGLSTALLASTAFAAPPAWEITDADSRIVLFPTIHVLPEGIEWETDQLAQEIKKADEVWLEVANGDSPAVQAEIQAMIGQYGTSPTNPLSARLNEEQMRALTDRLMAMGIPLSSIDAMQPWMAALMLTMTQFAQAGISPESGVETVLEGHFGDRPVRGLESATFQIGMLSSLSEEDQVGFLMSSLEDMDGMIEMFQELSKG